MKHLIVGGGIAGVQAAETIRRLDAEASVTIVGGETFPPYCRPMITMVLAGKATADQTVIREDQFYAALKIGRIEGEWIDSIDVEKREAHTDKGNVHSFDRLLIATGADPLDMEVEGSGLGNLFVIRQHQHINRMVHALSGAKRGLVIGCGPVGLKAAVGMKERGLDVTMVEKLGYPLPTVVDEASGEMIRGRLQDMGIQVKTGTQVTAFHGNGEVKEAVLSDGSKISCDLGVKCIGVAPSMSFLPRGQIQVNAGILVNEYLETSAPGIYAAGDVVETTDIVSGQRHINAIWPAAARQGHFAGINMAGRKVSYQGSLSRNVVQLGNMDILAGGMVNPQPSESFASYTREDRKRGTYRKLVFRDDILVGLVMVNEIEQGGVLLHLIRQKIPLTLDKEDLLHPSFNYGQLLSGGVSK
jgi:NAD(P)H-nitrite reductase large subunit